jgi:hypothetical protein
MFLKKLFNKRTAKKADKEANPDIVLCYLALELLRVESKLAVPSSGEMLILTFIIFCKAAGIKITDDWIDRALDSITSYRRTEG